MNNYLIHYGVKGMKWGVRHDPERKGRKRKKKHLTNGQKIAIGIGVCVGLGLIAYGAKQYGDLNSNYVLNTISKNFHMGNLKSIKMRDKPIKDLDPKIIKIGKDTSIFRVTGGTKENLNNHGHLYVNETKNDARRYALFLKEWNDGQRHVDKYKPKNELIGPSERTQMSTFMGLMTDKDFKLAFQRDLGRKGVMQLGFDSKNTRQYYPAFMGQLADKDSETAKIYFDKMRLKGYDVLTDDNDTYYFSSAARIVLDPNNKLTSTGRKRYGSISRTIDSILVR